MKTIQEISQWVIDNRYPKSENDKMSDIEMYHTLIELINQLVNINSDQFRNKIDLENDIDYGQFPL